MKLRGSVQNLGVSKKNINFASNNSRKKTLLFFIIFLIFDGLKTKQKDEILPLNKIVFSLFKLCLIFILDFKGYNFTIEKKTTKKFTKRD
ncbi:hypothetical protein PT317_01075 [Metamycoplasma hyosynoviae]|uniref:hypothetical protein n=1 Tax=Metamycoplasma hyosynoviae TaxID=29559 RepID=UPI00236304CB|nr:hypothetical protein [Metamycoplasma hyosynoviae]MDD1360118.1 hypothetical protein [Metamycoplasma hyosynoviae]MDD1360599.1 hypothetical protein [Metamycoplasma hyosynoviae]MDD1362287.1 hypothetical protein [Metamycoplasma hyosynoviae]MDD7894948.1 hypothetical protein [Metamycoplasma hyosynoviae]